MLPSYNTVIRITVKSMRIKSATYLSIKLVHLKYI